MEFILLALSVPFFYVLGVIQLVSWFRKKDDLDKKVFEKIKKEAKTSPTKTLREFYNENKEKHEIYIPQPEKSIAEPPEKVADKIAKSILQQDTGTLWNNWYSENSINLLLYLGAFLIVASASIFVGFQWDTLSGVVKSIVLTLLTLSFFGSGLWFHSIPKIKNAGMTFIGISALLIPICGTGWYNFVLKDMGVTGGAVWLLTSLVSLILYSYLAQKFKNSFFTYSASLATISLALSFVNVAGLNKQVYILASQAGSFALLLVGLATKKREETSQYIGMPLEISSNIVMPATLMYGLYAAIQTNSLFSFEAAAGVFIAALFYLVTYLTNKSVYSLFASQCLLPFGLILLFEYLKIPNNYLLYALEFVAALYLYVAFLLKKDSLSNESDTNLFSAGALTVIVFLLGYVFRISSWEQYLFALMPILAGVGTAYIKKDINYGYLSTAFTVISTWVLFMQVLDLHAHPQYLAHIMTSLGVFVFLLGLQKNVNKKNNTFFKVNTIFFFIVSVAIANIHLTTQSITFGVGALLLFILFLSEKRKEYLYGTALLLNISLLFLLPSYKVKAPIEHYPLYFSAIGIAFYASSFFFRKEADTLKTIGIVNQVFTAIGSIYFYTQSYSHIYNYYTGQAKDTASNMTFLLSGYILTFLTIADSQIRKRANMDYLASFFALGTYVWQLSFWHVSQTLYYTIPIGIYMLCIGFLREAHHDEKDNANILNLLGCCILIIPTFFLSQTSGYLYSALVGALGLLLLLIGITAKNRIYQFSGSAGIILAIIPQTFQYLLSLPKWLIVGIIGLIFVGFAIFLLLRRKEK